MLARMPAPPKRSITVGCPTVGIYWCGNLINAGPLFRRLHRPHVSWTVACPVCGVPAVATGERCPHDPSFVAGVEAGEVLASALDLLSHRPAR